MTVDTKGKARLTPAAEGVVGSVKGRIPTMVQTPDQATAQSAIDQIISMLAVDSIRAMKEQSRTGATGFGALSEAELNILLNSGSRLKNQKVGSEAYATALKEVHDKITTALSRSGGKAVTDDVVYDMDGKPVK